MKNQTNSSFSLRKLILAALVTGPMAILPAPLWALPSIDTTAATGNLTVSAGVSVVQAGANTLNITAPDKAVLSWVNFGGGGQTIALGDTLTYTLPTPAGSVLNLVTGNFGTTIDGSIISNGNVYVMNKNGIVIGNTAVINAGGFYASAIDEPLAAANFANTGSLSYSGTTAGTVSLAAQAAGAGTTTLRPQIQAVGSGNNIVLAGSSVNVGSGLLYGNLTARTIAPAVADTTTIQLSSGGALSVNQVSGQGGNISLISNGGNVIASGVGVANTGLTATLGAAPAGAIALGGAGATGGYLNSVSLTPIAATTAGSFTAGTVYTITSVGSTDYTLIGAANNNLGTTFTATGAGSGTGTATWTGATNSGTGYTPNATAANGLLPLTITAPRLLQNTDNTNTSLTTVGRTAVGYAITNSAGVVTGFSITDAGYGYVVPPTVSLDAPTGYTTTAAGSVSINTSGASFNGNVSQTQTVNARSVTGNQFSATGATTLTTGAAGSVPGSISLPNVDLSSVSIPYAGVTSITDQAGGINLGNTKIIAPNTATTNSVLTVSAGATAANGSIAMASSSSRVEIVASTLNTAPRLSLSAGGGSVTLSATGSLSFNTLSASTVSGTASITATGGDITTGNFAGKGLSLTGGAVTIGNLTNTSGTATIAATGNITAGTFNTSGAVKFSTSAGTLTAGTAQTNANQAGSGSEFKSAGELTLGSLASSSVTVSSSAGSVTITNGFAGAGSIFAAGDVNIGFDNTKIDGSAVVSGTAVVNTDNVLGVAGVAASNNDFGGRITSGSIGNAGAGYAPSSTVSFSIPAGGSSAATGYATTNTMGQLSGIVITSPGGGYTSISSSGISVTGLGLPVNSVVTNGALSIEAKGGSVSITNPIVSTSTSALTITSAQSLAVPAITAPTLSLTSTAGSITQTGAITSSGTATLSAATDVTLTTGTNNFGTVVIKNSPSGVTLSDADNLVIGNGTDAKGSVNVTAGAGLSAVTSLTVVPNWTAPSNGLIAATNTTNGVVTSGSITAGNSAGISGYPANAIVPITFTAPPTNETPANITARAIYADAAAFAANNSADQVNQAIVTVGGALVGVTLPRPIGNGYVPSSTVPVTFVDPGVGATVPTGWVGDVNANGQISRIRMADGGTVGSNLTAALRAEFAAPTTAAATTATGYATTNANGVITGITVLDGGSNYYGGYIPRISAVNTAQTAGSFQIGKAYTITTLGTTDFTAVGAAANTVGTTFTATAVGTGTGTATFVKAATGVNAATLAAPTLTGGAVLAAGTITGANNGYQNVPTVEARDVNNVLVPVTFAVATTSGAVTTVTPNATGGIALGSAATDSIRIAGDLAVTTSGPAGTVTATDLKYSEITTVANSVRVDGKVTATTRSANATIGAPTPLGGATAYYFGSINGNLGTGAAGGDLTVYENTTVNLGNLTARDVTATSTGGDIANTGAVSARDVRLSANSFFNPGTITFDNSNNNVTREIILANAASATIRNNATTTTIVNAASATGRGVTGNVSASAGSGRSIAFNATGGGDYSTIGFSVSGSGSVTVGTLVTPELNGVEIRNASSTGTGNVTVTAAGPIVLGSGISLLSNGTATFRSTGTNANITDSAPGVVIYGSSVFNSDNGISVTKSGHSFGPVTLTSGSGAAAATSANIAFTEAGTLNLKGLTVTATTTEEVGGSVVLTSTSGDIIQGTGAAAISLAALADGDGTAGNGVARSLSLNAAGGAVLSVAGNNSTIPVSVSATGNSSITSNSNVILGDVTVRSGTFGVNTSGAPSKTITQATGSKVFAYGDTSFNTQGGAITVANSGNNFGGLTLVSTNGAAAGANVSLSEQGTARLVSVGTGTNGTLSVVSEAGSIVSGPTPSITAGGASTFNAPVGITLNDGNNLTGAVKLTSSGSVTLQNGVTTTLAKGSSVGGSLTVRNTAGNITDAAAGGLTITGAVFFDSAGNVSITGSGNNFGAVQFRGTTVSIAEDDTLNLAGGSVANGNASLTSLGDIVTSGVGTSVFSGTSVFNGALQLNAMGGITVGNNVFVASGLTFRALGAVDLSAASLSGNLNGRNPVNLGAASYKIPSP